MLRRKTLPLIKSTNLHCFGSRAERSSSGIWCDDISTFRLWRQQDKFANQQLFKLRWEYQKRWFRFSPLSWKLEKHNLKTENSHRGETFKEIPCVVWWSSLDNQFSWDQLAAPLEMQKTNERERLNSIQNDETLNMCMSLIAICWCGLKQNIEAIAIRNKPREYEKQKGTAK